MSKKLIVAMVILISATVGASNALAARETTQPPIPAGLGAEIPASAPLPPALVVKIDTTLASCPSTSQEAPGTLLTIADGTSCYYPYIPVWADSTNIAWGSTTRVWFYITSSVPNTVDSSYRCTLYGGYGFGGQIALDSNGSYPITGITVGPFSSAGYHTFTVSCPGSSFTPGNSNSVTIYVNPEPAPSVNFSINQAATWLHGPYPTLRWSSSYASSCAASGASFWSGGKATSGSATLQAPVGNYGLYLSCSGSSGTTTKYLKMSVVDDTQIGGTAVDASEGITRTLYSDSSGTCWMRYAARHWNNFLGIQIFHSLQGVVWCGKKNASGVWVFACAKACPFARYFDEGIDASIQWNWSFAGWNYGSCGTYACSDKTGYVGTSEPYTIWSKAAWRDCVPVQWIGINICEVVNQYLSTKLYPDGYSVNYTSG